MTLLSVQSLSVAYAATAALSGVSLDLPPARRLAILGESGSGKSTLALAICGLLPPTARISGTIAVTLPLPRSGGGPGRGSGDRPHLGRDIGPARLGRDIGPARLGRDIGVVFQNPSGSLNPVLRIGPQIAEIAVVHRGLSWTDAETRAARLLDEMGIPQPRAALRRHPHEFSGGQRQRIALACALAADPVLLVADEPTSALDTVAQHAIVELLDRLVRDRGLALLFVTHDIALAATLADDILVLHAGRAMESGPTGQVLRTPAHAYTRALLAARLDLDTPLARRLPEIAPDFTVVTPQTALSPQGRGLGEG